MKKIFSGAVSAAVLLTCIFNAALACLGVFEIRFIPYNVYAHGSVVMAFYAALFICAAADRGEPGRARLLFSVLLPITSSARFISLQFATGHWFTAVNALVCVGFSLALFLMASSRNVSTPFSPAISLAVAVVTIAAGLLIWSSKLLVPTSEKLTDSRTVYRAGYCARMTATRVFGEKYLVSVDVYKCGADLGLGRFVSCKGGNAYAERVPVGGYESPELEWKGEDLYMDGGKIWGS